MQKIENNKNCEIYFDNGKINFKNSLYTICSRDRFKSKACYIKHETTGTISFLLTDEQLDIVRKSKNIDTYESSEPDYDEDEAIEFENQLKKEQPMSDTVNKEVLNKLKFKIYMLEKENAKTKKLSDTEMVERIRKIIQLEVDRDDN